MRLRCDHLSYAIQRRLLLQRMEAWKLYVTSANVQYRAVEVMKERTQQRCIFWGLEGWARGVAFQLALRLRGERLNNLLNCHRSRNAFQANKRFASNVKMESLVEAFRGVTKTRRLWFAWKKLTRADREVRSTINSARKISSLGLEKEAVFSVVFSLPTLFKNSSF